MKVELIEFTGKGRPDETLHAAHLLMFTKSTRLNMDAALMDKIKAMSLEEIKQELDYMSKTIPSSWEFIDVTFLISGVTRATAQQITRTRTASYAMQSQRVTDVREMDVTNPYEPGSEEYEVFAHGMNEAMSCYEKLVDEYDSPLQDARGILPMNSECNLVAKYNFRSFVDLLKARKSLRAQGEYASLARQMEDAVIAVWPWAELFLRDKDEVAFEMLENAANVIGITTGQGAGWEIAKAIDLLRKNR